MAKLLIQREGAPRLETEVLAATTIGRLKDCTVQLENPQISRVHAVITLTDDGYMLSDQGSMNGTHVNGTKLDRGQELILKHLDEIEIQSYHLVFDMGADAMPEVSSTDALSSEMILADLEKPPEPCVLLSHLIENRLEQSVWSEGEITLTVADIINETESCKTFRLVGDSSTLFSYKPGQFVTITVEIDGNPVKRSYSISSSPSRPHTLELTIKRVPGGLVSNWMNDRLTLGDKIKVRGPAGKFSCFNYPSRKMLCIAGGSGITPMMSMLRWIVDTAADIDVVLLVSGHYPNDFIFRKELETISARHPSLRVIFTVTSGWSGTESWTGLTGRCSAAMIELVAPDFLDRHVFLCGPKPFSEAMKSELKSRDYPMANLHAESFGEGRVAKGTKVEPSAAEAPAAAPAPQPAVEPVAPAVQQAPAVAAALAPEALVEAAAPAAEPVSTPAGFQVTFQSAGIQVAGDPDGNLLDLAEVHGVDIDYACRQGSCGSCRTKCVSGSVEMEENDLSDDERAEGWIYPCVACPTSDVVLDA